MHPMTPPNDPLDTLLDSWSKTPDPSPRLPAEVWRKIALTESEQSETEAWWPRIENWFSRPSFAVMFIAVCALTGLFFAELRVNNLQRERSAQLARSYLLLIDPLLNAPDIQSHP
jgi:type VI protein secretion system component VasK